MRQLDSPSVTPHHPAFVACGPEASTLHIFPITALSGLSLSDTSGKHENIRQHHKHNQGSPMPCQSFCCYFSVSVEWTCLCCNFIGLCRPTPNGNWHMQRFKQKLEPSTLFVVVTLVVTMIP